MTVFPAPAPVQAKVPGRGGYVIGGVIIGVGLLLGVGIFVLGLVSTISSLPAFTTQFDAGSPAAVTLTGGREWAIYAASASSGHPATVCQVASADGRSIALKAPSATFTVQRDGQQWTDVQHFTIDSDGTYAVACETADGGVSRYAIGPQPNFGGFFGGIVGSILALIGLPFLGLVIGVVLIVVTAVRRRRANALSR
jgi:hypothetical protein